MIEDQNFYDICFTFFQPTASATVYGRRPKFFRAKHSATAEGENCTYGPTLNTCDRNVAATSWLANAGITIVGVPFIGFTILGFALS